MFDAMVTVFSNDSTLYWLIYQVMMLLFFIVFVFIYQRGRGEFRPYTHRQFERLRLGCVVALLFDIMWTMQFILTQTKTISAVFGSVSDTLYAVILCFIALHIIHNYFALKSDFTPPCLTYYLYFWLFVTWITIIFRFLSYSVHTNVIHHLFIYCIYIQIIVNVTLFILLFHFIVLFVVWILIQHHRINLMDVGDSEEYRTPSDLTTGGEHDAAAQAFLLRLIGILCGFCIYFGFVVAFSIDSLHIAEITSYSAYAILIYFVCTKLVLLSCLAMYLFPRTDDYLSVNPNILDSLNINTQSNRKKKSTFRDPHASDKWRFHATGSVDTYTTSSRDDEEWEKDSDVSYTTLMFRKEQQKQVLSSTPKALNWLSYFSPPNGDKRSNQKSRRKSRKRKKNKEKTSRDVQRFASQEQQGDGNLSESYQSIRSMCSNDDK
eukprot:16949_1